MRSVAEFKNLVVRRDGDRLVRLSDVADVVLGAEDYNSEVRFSGEHAVFMGVWALPNANSLDVIKRVRKEMASIQKVLPTGLNAYVAYDATQYISDALHEVVKTLIITLAIVSVVIFLFLGSFRSVLIPLVAIPLSLIGAVFLMQVFGFTLNLLTLLAIVLAVGLVVDDAIVVVENIERHIREGKTPVDAALLGARELVGPVIAMTITLAAVYAPIAFQGGLTGSLFREFALTLAGAVFISGIVALTLSPVMASRLLSHEREDHGLVGRINRDFDRLKNFYGRVLDWTLARRPMVYTHLDRAVLADHSDVSNGLAGERTRAGGRSRRHFRRRGNAAGLDHRADFVLRGPGRTVHLPRCRKRSRFFNSPCRTSDLAAWC